MADDLQDRPDYNPWVDSDGGGKQAVTATWSEPEGGSSSNTIHDEINALNQRISAEVSASPATNADGPSCAGGVCKLGAGSSSSGSSCGCSRRPPSLSELTFQMADMNVDPAYDVPGDTTGNLQDTQPQDQVNVTDSNEQPVFSADTDAGTVSIVTSNQDEMQQTQNNDAAVDFSGMSIHNKDDLLKIASFIQSALDEAREEIREQLADDDELPSKRPRKRFTDLLENKKGKQRKIDTNTTADTDAAVPIAADVANVIQWSEPVVGSSSTELPDMVPTKPAGRVSNRKKRPINDDEAVALTQSVPLDAASEQTKAVTSRKRRTILPEMPPEEHPEEPPYPGEDLIPDDPMNVFPPAPVVSPDPVDANQADQVVQQQLQTREPVREAVDIKLAKKRGERISTAAKERRTKRLNNLNSIRMDMIPDDGGNDEGNDDEEMPPTGNPSPGEDTIPEDRMDILPNDFNAPPGPPAGPAGPAVVCPNILDRTLRTESELVSRINQKKKALMALYAEIKESEKALILTRSAQNICSPYIVFSGEQAVAMINDIITERTGADGLEIWLRARDDELRTAINEHHNVPLNFVDKIWCESLLSAIYPTLMAHNFSVCNMDHLLVCGVLYKVGLMTRNEFQDEEVDDLLQILIYPTEMQQDNADKDDDAEQYLARKADPEFDAYRVSQAFQEKYFARETHAMCYLLLNLARIDCVKKSRPNPTQSTPPRRRMFDLEADLARGFAHHIRINPQNDSTIDYYIHTNANGNGNENQDNAGNWIRKSITFEEVQHLVELHGFHEKELFSLVCTCYGRLLSREFCAAMQQRKPREDGKVIVSIIDGNNVPFLRTLGRLFGLSQTEVQDVLQTCLSQSFTKLYIM